MIVILSILNLIGCFADREQSALSPIQPHSPESAPPHLSSSQGRLFLKGSRNP